RTAAWIREWLIALAPDPMAVMDLGRRAEQGRRLVEAAEHYRRAAQLKPGWMLPVYNRASVLGRLQQREQARALFEQVAKQADTVDLRGGAWFHLGTIAVAEDRRKEAMAA